MSHDGSMHPMNDRGEPSWRTDEPSWRTLVENR
jgi:hypothetical protein